MTGLNVDQHRLIYRAIRDNPGLKAQEVARLTGLSRNSVRGSLPGMEKSGFLVAEDDTGRLYPFRIVDYQRQREDALVQMWLGGVQLRVMALHLYGYEGGDVINKIKRMIERRLGFQMPGEKGGW